MSDQQKEVFILHGEYDYEPGTVVGVFTQKKDAEAVVEEWKNTCSRDRLYESMAIETIKLNIVKEFVV